MDMAKSRHQIASEIAKSYTREGTGYADRLYQLADAIEAALKERDKRAMKIAEMKAHEYGELADNYWKEGDKYNATIRQGWSAGAASVVAAIRNEDTNAA